MNSNIIDLAVFIPVFFIIHLLIYNVQLMSGKQYFYGVYIKNIVIDEGDKKRIDKGYKRKMNLVFLIILLIFILNATMVKYNLEIVIVVLMLLYIGISFIYLKKYYEEVKLIKRELIKNTQSIESDNKQEQRKIVVDTELLKAKAKLKKKFKKLFGICILISLTSAFYLALNYNNLPDMIITHWGINGEPDAFSPKSVQSVFMLSFMDISLVLLVSFLAVETIGTRVYIDTNNLEVNRNKAIKYLNSIGYCFFLLTLSIQSITSTMPIFVVKQSNVPIILLMITLILPIFISIALMYYFVMLSSLKPKDKSINAIDSDDEKWLYGFIYYNEEDPSFMVEKRFGAGWTFNLANPKGKGVVVLLVLIILGTITIPLFM